MNKAIIIGGAVLLVVTGGAFLYLAGPSTPSMPEEEYSTTPTQWSQAGDYKIEETAEGTVVTNEKAGFSFEVPEGWSVEEKGEEPEFWLSLLSQDAQFDENGFFVGGCGINVETVDHSAEVSAVRASMDSGLFENQNIVEVGGITGVETINTPTDKTLLEKIGTSIKVDLPLNDDYLVTIVTQVLPSFSERCNSQFVEFLDQFSLAL